MADMLKFRKGTLAQINAADKVAGTIYIAKDEKAMYVDITDNERIRIGDLIRVSSVDKIEPPFSTTSLYYVEDQNALLGYDGTEWKQINGTEVLEDRLDTVEGTVAGHTSDIKNLSDYVGTFTHATAKTVVEYIEARTSGIATSENLQALTNRVTTAEGKITTIEGNITTINGDITSINDEISGHESRITDLEAASAKHAEKTYVDNTFAKANDVYTKTQVYTQTEADSKISAAVKVEADRAKEQEQTLDNTIKAVKATADAAVSTTTFTEFKNKNTQDIADAKSEAISDATSAANGYTDGKITAEVTRAEGAYAPKSLVQTVTGHTSILNVLDGEANVQGSVKEAKKRADDAYNLADAAVTTAELNEAIKNFATQSDLTTAKNAVLGEANYSGTVKGAYEAAAGAKSVADEALELAGKKTTTAEVDAQIKAFGYATVSKAEELANAAKAAAIEDAKKYALQSEFSTLQGTVGGHTSTLNTLTGDGEGSVADAKKAGTDAAAALNTYKNEHKNDYTNTQIDAAIKVAKDAADAAQGTATSAQNQAQANKAAIEILNGTDKEEGSVAKAIADAKAALSAEIDADIRSANALEYAGTISSTVSLPTTAKNGAVYVVEEAVDDYFAGDLVIAQGDEDENGLIPENKITWKRVKTGYDASLEQSILTEGNAIKLSSLSGKDNGAITFAADTSAAKVTVENNTVTIGIHWEDFK